MTMSILPGDRVEFTSTAANRARTGEDATVVRRLTAAEVGPMFRIRFDDGAEVDAFRDELSSPTAIEGD